jgi:aspartate/methionine/tyrosine aminotransferase
MAINFARVSRSPAPPQPARRLAEVLEPVIPQVAEWSRRHAGTLSLAQGMVGWGPPAAVHQAVQEALSQAAANRDAAAELDRYGPIQGDPALLQRIAAQLSSQHGLDAQGSALLVTAGSNMAFQVVIQALCDPGDEVILPVPWYFNHVMAVQLAGALPVAVAAGLQPDPERLAAAITPRSRAIVTVSPNNPSGVVLEPGRLAAINALCADRGLLHISDEAYAAFVHGSVPHTSPGAAPGAAEHTVTLQSLSKAYGMAGWRLGYAAVPPQLLAALTKVLDTTLICPPRLTQIAAIAALEAGSAWIAPRLAALGRRRLQLLEALAAIGERGLPARLLAQPDGAFYGLLAVRTSLPGLELVTRLIREHGVAALPGESFGLPARDGETVLRLSYGLLDGAGLAEALSRLVRGLEVLTAA